MDSASLPRVLAERYAELVSARLRLSEGDELSDGAWPLSRIADTYELVAEVQADPQERKSAAFVAATAQQILSKSANYIGSDNDAYIGRDHVSPVLSASLLFLSAQQYADAADAASAIDPTRPNESSVTRRVAESIRALCEGKLSRILELAEEPASDEADPTDLEALATQLLFETILVAVQLFAAEVLGESQERYRVGQMSSPLEVLRAVISLSESAGSSDELEGFSTSYPGPRYLARLLISAYDATAASRLTQLEPPPGSDASFWGRWLRHRSQAAPFIWPNHEDLVIEKQFHHPGISAMLVLPTGAGKTTVSSIKMAATLARGESVVFLAPTHALVDQLATDLTAIFPRDLVGTLVANDFEAFFTEDLGISGIEVMTPERCLALLSFAPEAFDKVGLVVFDECHLLSPESGLRRALDSMFCVLGLSSVRPTTDFLLLSAMVANGQEVASWVEELTGRPCIFSEPLWKPTRQARGVVVYESGELQAAVTSARASQARLDIEKGRRSVTVRAQAKRALKATPYAMFGLEYNWLNLETSTAECRTLQLSADLVQLNGSVTSGELEVSPNANEVAAALATSSAKNGLKTIVFVNTKVSTASTATAVCSSLGDAPRAIKRERALFNALEIELGGLNHSFIPEPATAIPHNAGMLRLERQLAESLFRRPNGASVIVATPTLAQGLNLPAEVAILAGDKRMDILSGRRVNLGSHEILNAAARAGRAGHLANGLVLMVPEPIMTFTLNDSIPIETARKLKSLLPEDDRCLVIADPLQVILDRITEGRVDDDDVQYAVNRLLVATGPNETGEALVSRFALDRSLAHHASSRRSTEREFWTQVAGLQSILEARSDEADDDSLRVLAAQSGAPLSALAALRAHVSQQSVLPTDISSWVDLTFDWLVGDTVSAQSLLGSQQVDIEGATGGSRSSSLTVGALEQLRLGLHAWTSGETIAAIESVLGGDDEKCKRARSLVNNLVPRALTYIAGLVARVASESELWPLAARESRVTGECFAAAIRKGSDSPYHLAYTEVAGPFSSRVQSHIEFDQLEEGLFDWLSPGTYLALLAQVRVTI